MFLVFQGEYVAPEKIEILLVRSPFVAQVFVDGDSLQVRILTVDSTTNFPRVGGHLLYSWDIKISNYYGILTLCI